jgi:hypothetical protein
MFYILLGGVIEMIDNPKIILPQDPNVRQGLEAKLDEYRGRIAKLAEQNPHITPEQIHSTDAGYKAAIVEELLTTGQVDTNEFSRRLMEMYGSLHVNQFNNAVGVIDDYCKTGGENVIGGTGLNKPKVETNISPKSENLGYEITVEIPGSDNHVFCVDNTGKIRGIYKEGLRHYMSDSELWSDHRGFGKMDGEFKKGGLMSAIDLEGNVLHYKGPIQNLRVLGLRQVDIGQMTSDPYIAGLDRPIWKPNALN